MEGQGKKKKKSKYSETRYVDTLVSGYGRLDKTPFEFSILRECCQLQLRTPFLLPEGVRLREISTVRYIRGFCRLHAREIKHDKSDDKK